MLWCNLDCLVRIAQDEQLREAVKVHGTDWRRVASCITLLEVTHLQCGSRFQHLRSMNRWDEMGNNDTSNVDEGGNEEV